MQTYQLGEGQTVGRASRLETFRVMDYVRLLKTLVKLACSAAAKAGQLEGKVGLALTASRHGSLEVPQGTLKAIPEESSAKQARAASANTVTLLTRCCTCNFTDSIEFISVR